MTLWTVEERAWKQELPFLPDEVIALLASPVVVTALPVDPPVEPGEEDPPVEPDEEYPSPLEPCAAVPTFLAPPAAPQTALSGPVLVPAAPLRRATRRTTRRRARV